MGASANAARQGTQLARDRARRQCDARGPERPTARGFNMTRKKHTSIFFHKRRADRRDFLKTAASLAALAAAPTRLATAEAHSTADKIIPGKDRRLIVHTARPTVIETPLELLNLDGPTPTPLVFVRNVQPADESVTLRQPATPWKLELVGLVDRPRTVDANDLAAMPQVEHELVLQCSGNGRSLFSASSPVKGTPWGNGAMANVSFSGVALQVLLERLGAKVSAEATYLSAEGRDLPAPAEQDFEHSIPLEEALRKSFLALRMNGQLLPAAHGGPLRLVTPGYYATMHVKWLSRLRFDASESNHTSQIPHYRTPRVPIAPGEAFVPSYANSEPTWKMKIKSVVLSPLAGATVVAGDVEFAGVAFNDGESPIEAVLVSGDRGRTWQLAVLQVPKSPYAWYRWRTTLRLSSGAQQIWARAIDRLGRTQPIDGAIGWNPQGYAWNGMEKIDVTVA
jgi:sulfite oxidase